MLKIKHKINAKVKLYMKFLSDCIIEGWPIWQTEKYSVTAA